MFLRFRSAYLAHAAYDVYVFYDILDHLIGYMDRVGQYSYMNRPRALASNDEIVVLHIYKSAIQLMPV